MFMVNTVRRLNFKELVSELGAYLAHLVGRNDISRINGDILYLCYAERLFGLKLRVVETVDSLFRSGEKHASAGQVDSAPFADNLINLFAAACRSKIDYFFEFLCRGSEKKAQTARNTS